MWPRKQAPSWHNNFENQKRGKSYLQNPGSTRNGRVSSFPGDWPVTTEDNVFTAVCGLSQRVSATETYTLVSHWNHTGLCGTETVTVNKKNAITIIGLRIYKALYFGISQSQSAVLGSVEVGRSESCHLTDSISGSCQPPKAPIVGLPDRTATLSWHSCSVTAYPCHRQSKSGSVYVNADDKHTGTCRVNCSVLDRPYNRSLLFIYLSLIAQSTRTGSPQGFLQVQYNTKHAHYINVKLRYKHNPKVSPFGTDLVKQMANKFSDAGNIAYRFGLAFQYQIFFKLYKRMEKTIANLKYCISARIKANTSAIWQHMLQIPPTKVLISVLTVQNKGSHTKELTFRKLAPV